MKYFSLRYLCLVLLGFFFGMFFTIGVLVVILMLTTIFIGVQEIKKNNKKTVPLNPLLYGEEFIVVLFWSIVVMFVTFYIATDQTSVQDFFVFIKKLLQTHVLR